MCTATFDVAVHKLDHYPGSVECWHTTPQKRNRSAFAKWSGIATVPRTFVPSIKPLPILRMKDAMTKTVTAAETAKPASSAHPLSDFPTFQIPSFEMPAVYQQLTQKSVDQAKQGCERLKIAVHETTEVFGNAYSTAIKDASEYNLKVIAVAGANFNAALDYATALLGAKSLSDILDLTRTSAGKQLEAFAAQGRELSALTQKLAADLAEPLKTGVAKALNNVA
jgi:phasin